MFTTEEVLLMYIPVLICSKPKRIESLREDFLINVGTGAMYPVSEMRRACEVGLFKAAPVYLGHEKETSFLGVVTRAWWSNGAGGVVGLIQPTNEESAKIIRQKGGISAYYNLGKSKPLGDDFRIVEEIKSIFSVDVVDEPLMGGRVLTAEECLSYCLTFYHRL